MISYCVGIKAGEIGARRGNNRDEWPEDDVKDWSARVSLLVLMFHLFPSVELKKTLFK